MDLFKKFFFILDKQEKKNFFLINFFVLILLVLEIFSIGLIFPLLLFLTENDILTNYPIINNFSSILGIETKKQLMIVLILLISSAYFIKTFYNLFVLSAQYKYSYLLLEKISNKLFSHYLKMPYSYHLNKNSALLIRNISEEVTLFIVTCLIPVISLISEGIMIFGILIFLVILEPLGALIVISILATSIILLNLFSRKRTNFWADIRQEKAGERVKILQQSLGIIDELKIFGREFFFIKKFELVINRIANSNKFQHIFLDVPRLSLELIAVVTFLMLILYLFLTNDNAIEIIPTIGIFAAASFRILPTTNRLLASLQRIKYARPIINFLYDEFLEIHNTKNMDFNKEKQKIQKINFNNCIKLENVMYGYDKQNLILKDVNLKIFKGEAIGIVGKSGSGKSTLLRILTGLLKPDNGTIKFDNFDFDNNKREILNIIGYVPQFVYLLDDTIKNNVCFGIEENNIKYEKLLESLKIAQIDKFISSQKSGIETIVGERGVKLSGGQRQRIGIARAIYAEPEIMIFDEPTSSLDLETEQKFFESIYKLKDYKTLIIVSHNKSVLEKCDKIYEIKNNELSKIR